MDNGRPQSPTDAATPATTAADASNPRLEPLLLRVAAGDQAAFAELYDAVAARVFGLAARIVRDHSLAAEVTQEVLLEVWRTAPRFDASRGSAIGWVLMMTHRRSVDQVRRTSARRTRESAAAVGAPPMQAPVDDAVMLAADHDELSEALGALSAVQLEAITLAYFEGHTYREVAEILGVPEGTAKSRLRDGITRLRERLEGGE